MHFTISSEILESSNFNAAFILEGLAHDLFFPSENFVDWTGVIYPSNSFPILPKESLKNLDPIQDGDGFRAGVNEWVAFGLAAKLASAQSSIATIVELGASQGLWCIPWVKYFNRVSPSTEVIALGIEAGDAIEETLRFWRTNHDLDFVEDIRSNRLILRGNQWQFHWLRRAVSDRNEKKWFPKVDITKDNGNQVSPISNINLKLYDEIEAITPSDIVSQLAELDIEKVSLLHIDIQGAESLLLESIDFYSLCLISDIVMLGTHSSEIELLAHYRLRNTHTLIASVPCEYVYDQNHYGLIKDGEQVWVNKKIMQVAINHKLIKENSLATEESIANYAYMLTQTRNNLGKKIFDFQMNTPFRVSGTKKELLKKSLIKL
jgi:hypothetical protein